MKTRGLMEFLRVRASDIGGECLGERASRARSDISTTLRLVRDDPGADGDDTRSGNHSCVPWIGVDGSINARS